MRTRQTRSTTPVERPADLGGSPRTPRHRGRRPWRLGEVQRFPPPTEAQVERLAEVLAQIIVDAVTRDLRRDTR